jgi:hypothetical protein
MLHMDHLYVMWSCWELVKPMTQARRSDQFSVDRQKDLGDLILLLCIDCLFVILYKEIVR